jgi:hypothetical protein
MKKICLLVPLLTITAVVFSSCALIIDGVALMKKGDTARSPAKNGEGGTTLAEYVKAANHFIEARQKDVNQFVVAVTTLKVGSTTFDQALEILGRPHSMVKNKDTGVTTSTYELVDKPNGNTDSGGHSERVALAHLLEPVAMATLYFGNDDKLKCVEIIKTSSENGVHTSETIYKKGNR